MSHIFYLEEYKLPPYRISHSSLFFQLHPQETKVRHVLDVALRPQQELGSPLIFAGENLRLIALKINGKEVDSTAYRVTETSLELLHLQKEQFTLEIETLINPENNLQLMGLYRSNNIFCTQCEAEGFRRITYSYDRPDILSTYTVRIEADKKTCPVLLSNGNCLEKGNLENGRHYALWEDPFPKPSYLFALVAGKLSGSFDHFVTQSGRKVGLAIYVEEGKQHQTAYALDALKRSMAWDEKRFGREYDLDLFNIVAVSDFNMGAMENKGLNIFNDKYILADPQIATDADYANIEAIIAHEYFHNWTGNRITCRDWFQLCLKEGLTVYRDQEFSREERDADVNRIAQIRFLRSVQFAEDSGPLCHPVRPRQYSEINNFYTATVYQKGAELVRMLHCILGAAAFHQGLDLYFNRHDGQACTVEDFIQCFADVSGHDFSQFMLWYEQAGTPYVEATHKWENGQLTLSFTQQLYANGQKKHASPMLIPITFALLDAKGQEVVINKAMLDNTSREHVLLAQDNKTGILLLTQQQQNFTFSCTQEGVTPSLLRGFSSPIILQTDFTDKQTTFLAKHDSDAVNKFLHLQKLVLNTLLALYHEEDAEENLKEVLQLLGNLAQDSSLTPAFIALCLTIPSEKEIEPELKEEIDFAKIYALRHQLIKSLAHAHPALWQKIWQKFSKEKQPYAPDAKQAGQRSLAAHALCFSSLVQNDVSLVFQAYCDATNMSEKISALAILTTFFYNTEATAKALKDFENSYKHNALIIDKWFTLQALAIEGDPLQRIQALTKHPLFTWTNPNRVRSLIGSFVAGNPIGFHEPSGAAYQYFFKILLQIDKNNSQLSARLLTLLSNWKKLPLQQKTLIEQHLNAIKNTPHLSRDLSDICLRLLQ